MTPLDVSTLGTIIGKLQNAASATAHGLHEDARDDAKRAGELLIGMLGWYVGLGQGLQDQWFAAQQAQALGVAHWQSLQSQGLEQMREAYLAECPEKRTVYDAKEPDPLVAAKERLGFWLSAAPGRTWDHEHELAPRAGVLVALIVDRDRFHARGTGPDLASAILSALEKASGGA
jgi:hypothetical protein